MKISRSETEVMFFHTERLLALKIQNVTEPQTEPTTEPQKEGMTESFRKGASRLKKKLYEYSFAENF